MQAFFVNGVLLYMAEKLNSTDQDQSQLVMNNFRKINQKINEDAIFAMREEQYEKNYSEKHTRQTSYQHLSEIQSSHSKVKDIMYNKFMAQF